jgi:hypothetical protein
MEWQVDEGTRKIHFRLICLPQLIPLFRSSCRSRFEQRVMKKVEAN